MTATLPERETASSLINELIGTLAGAFGEAKLPVCPACYRAAWSRSHRTCRHCGTRLPAQAATLAPVPVALPAGPWFRPAAASVTAEWRAAASPVTLDDACPLDDPFSAPPDWITQYETEIADAEALGAAAGLDMEEAA